MVYIQVVTNFPYREYRGRLLGMLQKSSSNIYNGLSVSKDQGYGRGGTPIFTGAFEPLARVALYPKDEDGLGTWFGAA